MKTKIYKSKYGHIKDGELMLYPLDFGPISLHTITEIKISEKESDLNYLFNYFRRKEYDFTIVLDTKKEITFSFTEKSLSKAIAFKNRILHIKFSNEDALNDQSNLT